MKLSTKTFLGAVLLALSPLAVRAEYPNYIIRFSGQESERADDPYWISNHEIIIDGWYYNLNTRQIIPPYLDIFPSLSPYDGRTLVYLREPYLYLSTTGLYSQGVPPLQIAKLPLGTIAGSEKDFSFHVSWISESEILIIFLEDHDAFISGNLYRKKRSKFFIYSLSNSEFTEIGEDSLPDILYFKDIRSARSYTKNRVVINGREPEIPFRTSLLYQYIPGTKTFALRARLNELGFVHSGISPEFIRKNGKEVALIYDVNIMDNNRVYYSLIDDGECTAFDSENRNAVKRVRFPSLLSGRYDTSYFSPGGSSLIVIVRPDFSSYYYYNSTLEYLIFSEGSHDSYLHSIYIKEPFGIMKKNYTAPRNAGAVVSELLESFPDRIKTAGTRGILKNWILFLNAENLTNEEAYLTSWNIPKEGTLLFILRKEADNNDLRFIKPAIIEMEVKLNG